MCSVEMILDSEKMEGSGVGEVRLLGNGGVIWVSVEEIMPNKSQPRRIFDKDGLEELAESLREHGVLQPVIVRKCLESGERAVFKYELIAGERRVRAARIAGMREIPCILVDVDEEKSAELAIIENLHREDLNFFEIASAMAALIELYGMTQEEVAVKMSLTQPAVANKLRLLRFSEFEREMIIKNNLTERHARAVLRIKDDVKRLEMLREVVFGGWNVKQTEFMVEKTLECVEKEAESGVKTVRDTINWSGVEKQEGIYNWNNYDWWLKELEEHEAELMETDGESHTLTFGYMFDAIKIVSDSDDCVVTVTKGKITHLKLNIKNYFEVASKNIKEMYNQTGKAVFKDNIMVKGLIVRVLLLPGHLEDTKKIIKYLYDEYQDNIYISIMNQYTPIKHHDLFPNLNRKVLDEEYDELINYACDLGIEKAFIQEGDTQSESFIPDFNLDGVR